MSSPVETKRIRDHLQIEEGGGAALPEVSATDNGDVLTVVEGEWAKAAPAGGGLVVETEFLDLGQYEKGMATIMDADDIVAAIKNGTRVVVHFVETSETTTTSYGICDAYMVVVGYTEDDPNYDGEYISFASDGLGHNLLNWYNQLERTEDNKFLFRIYID